VNEVEEPLGHELFPAVAENLFHGGSAEGSSRPCWPHTTDPGNVEKSIKLVHFLPQRLLLKSHAASLNHQNDDKSGFCQKKTLIQDALNLFYPRGRKKTRVGFEYPKKPLTSDAIHMIINASCVLQLT